MYVCMHVYIYIYIYIYIITTVPIGDLQLFHPRNLTHITHITHICVYVHVYVYVSTHMRAGFLYVIAADKQLREIMRSQFIIFKSPHTYVMSWLYVVCFGTFIGFSSSFPKLIQDIFGYVKCSDSHPYCKCTLEHTLCRNQNAPPAALYAFLGPLLGSLIRPFGGWLSDKFGGAVVTQFYIGVMTGSAIGIGIIIEKANQAQQPEEYFNSFIYLFLLLFTTAGRPPASPTPVTPGNNAPSPCLGFAPPHDVG